MRILFVGGGTAGHINPAIAVANHIKEKDPKAEIL
ncbi:MAG: glycosyltransferase, partial [Clostridia bacterium]|nr:glycosyltransferase [Clostridia bacterium]